MEIAEAPSSASGTHLEPNYGGVHTPADDAQPSTSTAATVESPLEVDMPMSFPLEFTAVPSSKQIRPKHCRDHSVDSPSSSPQQAVLKALPAPSFQRQTALSSERPKRKSTDSHFEGSTSAAKVSKAGAKEFKTRRPRDRGKSILNLKFILLFGFCMKII